MMDRVGEIIGRGNLVKPTGKEKSGGGPIRRSGVFEGDTGCWDEKWRFCRGGRERNGSLYSRSPLSLGT